MLKLLDLGYGQNAVVIKIKNRKFIFETGLVSEYRRKIQKLKSFAEMLNPLPVHWMSYTHEGEVVSIAVRRSWCGYAFAQAKRDLAKGADAGTYVYKISRRTYRNEKKYALEGACNNG